ncbi:MAG TPA: hypothetical protein VL172_17610, partial [Kofleriaceae bacterium]|nr:hypothetical protein [Kofleriaceae bacterium]
MRWAGAAVAALLAVVVFQRVQADELPAWVARRIGGVSPLAVRGGVIARYVADTEPAAPRHLLEAVRERVDSWAVADAEVGQERDGSLVIVLPGVPEHRMESYRGLLQVGGVLEFRMVADGQGVSRRVYDEVEHDSAARARGIRGRTDTWSQEDNREAFRDYYLTGPDPVTIDRYLAEVYLRRPDLMPPAGTHIAYEARTEPDEEPNLRARTYLVFDQVHLDGGDVAGADFQLDPQMGRPVVMLTFTREGGERFGDLTAGSVGHKLAIMLDGTITSAPVIQSAIRGGRSMITMGGTDQERMAAEARDLVGVLRSGALDVRLTEVALEYRRPSASRGRLLAARGAFALACGLLLLAALWIGRDELRRIPLGRAAAILRLGRPAAAALADVRSAGAPGARVDALAAALDARDPDRVDAL